jgi:threonine dehydrogenase-like Zn-dependent dehydrogenase
MKAVVFHGIGDIRLEEVPEPRIEKPTDAVVRLTANAICGTDLHTVRGTLSGPKPGTILGHEGVGIVEEIGSAVRNLKVGDRVVIPSTIACGNCSYCRAGYYAQCDNATPDGQETAFFGGGESAGGYQGLQAEKARIPFANVGLVKLPDDVTDEAAILLSDIFPTGYMAAEMAETKPGRTIAVFGCGPVGQFAIASAKLMDAGRILAVDAIESRLEMARRQGAEVINFNKEDPVEAIKGLTGNIGVDRAIDAVGVDADRPHHGPGAKKSAALKTEFDKERGKIAPKTHEEGPNWHPGDAPSQALRWAVEALAKAGTLSIVGVYAPTSESFPIGTAMGKNLTIRMGNCNHRKYIPKLLELVRTRAVDPTEILTHVGPLTSAIEAYKEFDRREPGWIKVKLEPLPAPAVAA